MQIILALLLVPLFIYAQDLPPGQMLLPEEALPEYEAKIDHARLIRDTSKSVLKLGKSVYQQNCASCHGTPNTPGSVPNALGFWDGKFQHGKDPYTMYLTLTRGWRMMAPQAMLKPREKYAVIHYIQETYLKKQNPAEYFKVNQEYLSQLPKGRDLGPAPEKRKLWEEMDYGNFLMGTFEIADTQEQKVRNYGVGATNNLAYKGIAQRLDPGPGGIAKGHTWSAFEHDTLRVAGVWRGNGFIDWRGINFDGQHAIRPRTIGEPFLECADGPGWANPETGKFEDLRFQASDGNYYGPLPKSWCQYHGLFKFNNQAVLYYQVGEVRVSEMHALSDAGTFIRHLNIGKSEKALVFRTPGKSIRANVKILTEQGRPGEQVIRLLPEQTPLQLVLLADGTESEPIPAKLKFYNILKDKLSHSPAHGGIVTQWPDILKATIVRGKQDGAFQSDEFTLPVDNPWNARLRASGLDFSPDGKSAYLCFWDGDVWKVDGIADESRKSVEWKRIAAGLFQPLGIKIRNGEVFVSCRDQIVRLVDLNGDEETDFYEAFNSDHQVTEHFHEFAMGLQTDEQGNFYYAKSARHARPQLIPHHGTLIKVMADGKSSEVLAHGFRAANGVCRNPDGTFFVTDQEGHWNPQNRINHVVPSKGKFYGNMYSYGAPKDSSDSAMEQPLCWAHKRFDRSPAELLWVESPNWGELDGKLLHFSYGQGRVEVVPHENLNGQLQGGMVRLPIADFPTGIMRGRFHPKNKHLYLCGMSAWASSQPRPGGFYRLRATGKPMHMPVSMRALKKGVEITFSDPISSNSNPQAKVSTWALKRTKNYGSPKFDEKELAVSNTSISEDGKTLRIEIPDIAPCWQMSIRYEFIGENGRKIAGEIQNTIHSLGDS